MMLAPQKIIIVRLTKCSKVIGDSLSNVIASMVGKIVMLSKLFVGQDSFTLGFVSPNNHAVGVDENTRFVPKVIGELQFYG
jgi:hypothetical protein